MVDWPGSEHLTGVESDRRTHRCLMGIDRPDTILPAPKRPWKIFKAYLLILDRVEFHRSRHLPSLFKTPHCT